MSYKECRKAGTERERGMGAILPGLILFSCIPAFLIVLSCFVRAEELWLHDSTRVYGLVQRVTADDKLGVALPTGQDAEIPLEDIISIRFLGREPLLVQSGTQEFRFVNGGRLRGQVLGNKADAVAIETAVAGLLDLNLGHVKGFVALPLAGFTGRKAEELVESELGERSPHVDTVLDRRGGLYPGVVRRLTRTELWFDIDSLLQVKQFPIQYVKGVRLADAARAPHKPWAGDVQVVLWTRDGSVVQGKLAGIRLGKWQLKPAWDPASVLEVALDEIALVQTLGGRVQYLSQLTPVEVKEQTILAPPQPYQMDRSCQGDALSIAGNRYPWGIGVHADSELTFALPAGCQEFRAAVGIATRIGDKGSVQFVVLGDGKELYASPVVRGSDKAPREVRAPLAGVKRLTLKVTNAGDLDLGDVANWGSARVLRTLPNRTAGGQTP
ncbi:MAG: hypothetical protein FJ291_15500 [Planctomycetes bacterium]|nr:hypothetical protein [Planctomycetota bacterium]